MVQLRVVLADDHPFVRLGVRSAVSAHADIVIAGESANPTSLIELLQKVRCDVLVTDLSMPEADGTIDDGMRLVRRIRCDWPALRIVVLTSLASPVIARSILLDGAVSLLNKAGSMDELVSAIRSASAGHVHISQSILAALTEVDGAPPVSLSTRCLSPRETEVVGMFVRGRSVSEIARVLGRDIRTVSRQKRIAMAKLGVDNDPALFAYVRVHGTV